MAQRFEFRLETVHRLRKQEADRQRRVLGEAIQNAAANERRVLELTQELDLFMDHSRMQRTHAVLDAASLRGDQLYFGLLRTRISTAQADLRRYNAVVSQERERLGQCTKRVKVIEKLRDRQWQRFRRDAERRERTEADEMSTQRFIRALHGGTSLEVGA